MTEAISYQTERIDHLGIIAGICNHIELAKLIDRHVTGGKERKVTCGQAVQAMILNALGLSSRPLYLISEAMANKPVDVLIGKGLKAADFNDDTLGRALDDLHQTGITGLFHLVAKQALRTYEITPSELHTDTTTFSLQGKYKQKKADESVEELNETAENTEPAVVHVAHGFSKDHRHDLKQVVVTLITTESSNLPMWLEILDGNSSDKTSFPQTVAAYCEQLSGDDAPQTFVMDSAWYTADNVAECPEKAYWVSRVPETISAAKIALAEAQSELVSGEAGYKFYETKSTYGGVPQRWLVVYSPEAYEREKTTFLKRVNKMGQQVEKEWKKVQKQQFNCEQDAMGAIKLFNANQRFHQVDATVKPVSKHLTSGRPPKGAEPTVVGYCLVGNVIIDEVAFEEACRTKGRFIVATNQLDRTLLSSEALLATYKAQGSSVERGFRFLKDPMFFADSLFVKNPKRIMALIMIMGLSLLIYALAERELRQQLQAQDETLPDQSGKPTKRMTMRRVAQIFEGVDILLITLNGETMERQVLNLSELRIKILKLFNPEVQKCYFLPD